ncbi:unnamed protein product [Dicrocoelium dendriticum]|nr:unnamed protein product [Dicrocoelium dendriticum]
MQLTAIRKRDGTGGSCLVTPVLPISDIPLAMVLTFATVLHQTFKPFYLRCRLTSRFSCNFFTCCLLNLSYRLSSFDKLPVTASVVKGIESQLGIISWYKQHKDRYVLTLSTKRLLFLFDQPNTNCSSQDVCSLSFFDFLFPHLMLAPTLQVKSFAALKKLKMLAHSSKALTFATLIFGSFVAGLDAGLVYNSWPKMADRWIPTDLIAPQYGSVMSNLLNNPTSAQFSHRLLAYCTVLTVTALWATVMRARIAQTGPRIRLAAHLALASAWGQSVLGILTLLNYVPVSLGVMHQGGSLVLLSALLWFTHCLRAVPK